MKDDKPAQRIAMQTKQELANRIKHERLKRHWSRPMLAERSGVNQYTLKRFERSGDICLNDFLALIETFDATGLLRSLLKPRVGIDLNSWTAHFPDTPQRGRRREPETVEND